MTTNGGLLERAVFCVITKLEEVCQVSLELEEFDESDIIFICEAEGLMISRMPGCDSRWWVSRNHGHQEGYGPFYHKEPMACGETILKAYLNFKLKEARQITATRNPKAIHAHLDQVD